MPEIHYFIDDENEMCGRTRKSVDWEDTYSVEEVTCYECLDILVELGDNAAERLTELPPRVS